MPDANEHDANDARQSASQRIPPDPPANAGMKTPAKDNTSTCLGILVGLAGGCCIIFLVVFFFVVRLGYFDIPELFPSATPVFTLTPTITRTPIATRTPITIPGIDQPISVNGLDVKITAAHFEQSYKFLDQTLRPSKTGEVLLVVEGVCLTSDMDKVKGWKVSVGDDAGNMRTTSVTVTSKKEDHLELTWVFVVVKNSGGFTLYFPGKQEIDLSSILEK
jgi:hypothetical protein